MRSTVDGIRFTLKLSPDVRAVKHARRVINRTKIEVHFDEDTVPHGQCQDPESCDCCCPACWTAKALILRRGLAAARRLGRQED